MKATNKNVLKFRSTKLNSWESAEIPENYMAQTTYCHKLSSTRWNPVISHKSEFKNIFLKLTHILFGASQVIFFNRFNFELNAGLNYLIRFDFDLLPNLRSNICWFLLIFFIICHILWKNILKLSQNYWDLRTVLKSPFYSQL